MTSIADRLPAATVTRLATVGDTKPDAATALREELDASLEALRTDDPYDLAVDILNHLDPESYIGALGQCLPAWIRSVLDAEAREARQAAQAQRAANRPVTPAPTTADRVRNWYANQLAANFPTQDGMKPFGDCSATDLRYVAEIRRRQVAHLEAVAAFMQEHRIPRVSLIAEVELRGLMGAKQ